jgi:hypothetical protein
MQKFIIILLLCATALPGCASTIMKGYVSRDISSVVANYGPPINTYHLPNGQRAFQWEIIDTSYVPETVEYDDQGGRGHRRSTSVRSGGYVKETACFYTFYASSGPNGGWTITGFEKPSFECE